MTLEKERAIENKIGGAGHYKLDEPPGAGGWELGDEMGLHDEMGESKGLWALELNKDTRKEKTRVFENEEGSCQARSESLVDKADSTAFKTIMACKSLCSQEGGESIRKGRFVITHAHTGAPGCLSTLQYRKGRFQITESIAVDSLESLMVKRIFGIVSLQNKQIDILFDMIKNISGGDKLFQKEFVALASDVDELLSGLRNN